MVYISINNYTQTIGNNFYCYLEKCFLIQDNKKFYLAFGGFPQNGTAESVMCDVIKICLKRKDERRSGKGNPYKRDGFRRIFMTSYG